MEFFQSVLDLFTNLQPIHYILLVFAAYFVENLFPPLPGDTMLVFSAYIFGLNHFRGPFLWLYIASIIGAVLGFMLMVYFGYHFGRQFFVEKNYKYASFKFLRRIEEQFSERGIGVILWNRLFFGMRPLIGLVAGMSKIPWYKTLWRVIISASIFNLAFIVLGYLLGEHWSLISSILQKYMIFTIVLVVLLLLFIVWKWINRKKI